jgi:uncharacterized protein YdhG (YjbR/CyaY superfamily)
LNFGGGILGSFMGYPLVSLAKQVGAATITIAIMLISFIAMTDFIIKDTNEISEALELICNMYPYSYGGKKPEGFVFDEDKSVKWNREEVEKHNALVSEQKKKAMQLSAQMYQNYINDLAQAAYDEYDISESQFRLIYEKVMEYTEYDYICAANVEDVEDYVYFISNVINAM